MIRTTLSIALLAPAAALMPLLLVSCSSTSGDHVSAKKYTLDHTERVEAADPAIRFEQRHRLYGCISTEDMQARDGTYYSAKWQLADAGTATLKFEYRRSKTASKIFSQTVDVSGGSGKHEFSVLGPEVKADPVTSWKISLVRGKEELAAFKSYIWE